MIKIGLAQINVTLADRKANEQRVADWMAHWVGPRGAADYTTVVVLPELWNQGFDVAHGVAGADRDAEQAVDFLSGLAQRYGVWFAGGSVLASSNGRLVNRALAMDPRGKLVASYDKAHLTQQLDENKLFQHGERMGTFDLDGVPSAQIVCYDLFFPEWVRLHALAGTQVLFVAAAWPLAAVSRWQGLLRGRAAENSIFVAGCNQTGFAGHTLMGGASAVVDPRGVVACSAGYDLIEGPFAVVDLSLVQQCRDRPKMYEDRRPDLYRRWEKMVDQGEKG